MIDHYDRLGDDKLEVEANALTVARGPSGNPDSAATRVLAPTGGMVERAMARFSQWQTTDGFACRWTKRTAPSRATDPIADMVEGGADVPGLGYHNVISAKALTKMLDAPIPVYSAAVAI